MNWVPALEPAREAFEALFSEVVRFSPNAPKPGISPTGEPYIEFSNDGFRVEGEHSTVFDFLTDKRVLGRTIHNSAEDAISQWLEMVTKYATPMLPLKPTLYWRIEPEVGFYHIDIQASNGLFRVPSWTVYSRFLISNKPAMIEASHG